VGRMISSSPFRRATARRRISTCGVRSRRHVHVDPSPGRRRRQPLRPGYVVRRTRNDHFPGSPVALHSRSRTPLAAATVVAAVAAVLSTGCNESADHGTTRGDHQARREVALPAPQQAPGTTATRQLRRRADRQ
jgi:hypothetical protein